MFVVHVHVRVKKDKVSDFIQATRENASASIHEPGIVRFDIFQTEQEDSFILEEIYRTQSDSGKHKDTAHYKKWKNTVENMMAEPRSSVRMVNVYPADEEWPK